jgi:hypothetical protein
MPVERAERGADQREVGGVGEQRLVDRGASPSGRCASTSRAGRGRGLVGEVDAADDPGLPRDHAEVDDVGVVGRADGGGGVAAVQPVLVACIESTAAEITLPSCSATTSVVPNVRPSCSFVTR